MSSGIGYPGNNGVYSRRVKVFLCPSDPSAGPDGTVTIDGYTFGASSYAPNALVSGTKDPPGPQGRTTLTAVNTVDGTSNTILHAEKYARCSNTYMAPQFQKGGTAWAYCNSPLFGWQRPPMNPPGRPYGPGFCIGAYALRGAPDAVGPNSKFQPRPRWDDCDPTRASTAHGGGIQVGLAGGGARTLPPGISEDSWWWAVTPTGGETLGPDW